MEITENEIVPSSEEQSNKLKEANYMQPFIRAHYDLFISPRRINPVTGESFNLDGAGLLVKFGGDLEHKNKLSFCPHCLNSIHGIGIDKYINIELESTKKLYCLMCIVDYLNLHAKELEKFVLVEPTE